VRINVGKPCNRPDPQRARIEQVTSLASQS
jgi:hypothetical protein